MSQHVTIRPVHVPAAALVAVAVRSALEAAATLLGLAMVLLGLVAVSDTDQPLPWTLSSLSAGDVVGGWVLLALMITVHHLRARRAH